MLLQRRIGSVLSVHRALQSIDAEYPFHGRCWKVRGNTYRANVIDGNRLIIPVARLNAAIPEERHYSRRHHPHASLRMAVAEAVLDPVMRNA